MSRGRDALLVLVPAALVAFAHLGLRDVTGEEVVFYFGLGPLEILQQAIDPASEGAFHAHQPLSYLVRRLVLAVAGETTATTMRIHAAALATAGAVATWWVAGRAAGRVGAVVAGLVVGCSPLLAYYAHEASNYAASPLFGAIALAALIDLRDDDEDVRRRGRVLLVVGVLGGLANDWFFGFAVVASLALTPWGRAEARRAWAAVAVVAAPLGVVFLWSLGRVPEAKRLAPHLDPSEPTVGAWAALVDAFLGGTWPPETAATPVAWIVLGLLGVGLALGARGPVRLVAAWGAVVCVVGAVSAGLFAASGSMFTTSPRAFLVVLPALGVVLAAGTGRRGRGGAALVAVVGAAVLVHQAVPTAWIVFAPTQGVRAARAHLAGALQPGDRVFGQRSHRVASGTLPHGIRVATPGDPCTPPDQLRGTVWVLSSRPLALPPGCDGPLDLPSAGWAPTEVVQTAVAPHDVLASGFHPEVHLTRWERRAAPRTGPFEVVLRSGPSAPPATLELRRPDGVLRHAAVPEPRDGLARLPPLRMPEGTVATVAFAHDPGSGVSFDLVGPRAGHTWHVVSRASPRSAVRRVALLVALLLVALGAGIRLVDRFRGPARTPSPG